MLYENTNTFENPILPGFYPDPSICRVGEDYYLVTSTFAYFPGVPIFHSRDLVHWRQIGHVLDRPSQLPLEGAQQSGGIFAPTIRYHNGVFYMITTNVSGGGNFLVTAKDPAGPWSDPYWLSGAPGIDPSLYFEEDGRAYYVGTRPAPEGPRYYGNWEVWAQELDLSTMQLKGEVHSLWRGALRDAVWPEGPHIYKINQWYYLMISEGGTAHHHAITIARSKEIFGPYEGHAGNPILTHRHLGKDYPIVNVGHGDLVQTQNNEWWMVLLASRPYGGYYRNLGRETFLVPVKWEDGWPVVSPGTGRVEKVYQRPQLPICRWEVLSACDQFETTTVDSRWIFLRTPKEDFYTLIERPGYLRLRLRPQRLSQLENPSFMGWRQQHMNFTASTAVEFVPQNEKESAGMVLLQSNMFHFRYEYTIEEGRETVRLIRCQEGKEELLAKQAVSTKRLYLKVEAYGQSLRFYYGLAYDQWKLLMGDVDGRILSTDVAGGFVGAVIGLYASSNEQISENSADFDWFEYRGI